MSDFSNDACIAFLDSGVGGLPYLALARERLPAERYVYVADTQNFPYGEKTNEQITELQTRLVSKVLDAFSPKIVVLACNTASVAALSPLRERFETPFVGVVPAIKPAAALSRNRKIGLLATTRTINDAYTEDLIRQFAADCRIERVADGSIVSFVERQLLGSTREERETAIRSATDRFIDVRIDTLILGCTHFIYLDDELRSQLTPDVAIVDSRIGVVNQLERVVRTVGEAPVSRGGAEIVVTGNEERFDSYREFSKRFDLRFTGVMRDYARTSALRNQ